MLIPRLARTVPTKPACYSTPDQQVYMYISIVSMLSRNFSFMLNMLQKGLTIQIDVQAQTQD